MTTWSTLRRTSRYTRLFLLTLCLVFNAFAVLRALPVNSSLHENREANRGTYNRNVYRVFKLAKRQAAPPFFEVKNHAIFFDRNPGLFMFVAELFVRGGATTPLPNQLLSIALWNGGLLLLFLWLLMLFRSELAAAVGVGYLALTPFLLFYSSSIHHEPWCFFFFNLMFFAYVRYLRNGRRADLITTWIAYFLLCQSYWFYYMSAGLLVVALQWHERKLSVKDTLLLASVPVIATLTTFIQVCYALGGVEAALFRMKDIAAARTLDMRIENSQWYPDKKFVKAYHWKHYPETVRDRIQLLSGTQLTAFAAMLFASIVMAGRAAWHRVAWLLLALFAGMSWHFVMIQHTVIHRFAGMYGWFAWVLLVAVFVRELQFALRNQALARVVAALSVPVAVLLLQHDYIPYFEKYLANARAGQALPDAPVAQRMTRKSKRPSPPDAPRAADSLTPEDMLE